MGVKVSVIIPVYNAERYVSRCIESLVRQTLSECEYIFVNDGSKDNSRLIVEKYQQGNARIKLINQENQGVSVARNIGIEQASGEYVGFVDADDDIEPDMFEILYLAAIQDECDAVISNFESEMGQHLSITRYPFPVDKVLDEAYIKQEIMPYFIRKDDLNTACSKLYRRAIIDQFKVTFPKNVALGEDGMFNLRFFRHASAIKYLDYTGYHYREVAGSATRNILSKDYFRQAKEVYLMDLTEMLDDNLDKARIKHLQSIKFIHSVMSYIYVYFAPTREVGFRQRFSYVNKMIRDHHVQEALPSYYRETHPSLGRYDKCILTLMQFKMIWGLYFATAYSRLRNK